MYSVPGFDIKELLHESDHSLVARVGESAAGRTVLVKFLNRRHPGNEEIERFRHEYETFLNLAGIDGIARALSLEEHGNLLFIVFEDVGGESLERHIRKHHLSLRSFLSVATGMAGTLHHVHNAGIVHRHIDPSRYLYDPVHDRAHLIDLGIAAQLAKDGFIPAGNDHARGLLAYISPEETGRMNRRVDWRTDLYSLGVTLYEMITGRLPFETTSPLEIVHAHIAREPIPPCEVRPGIPHVISSIIMKLLSKDAAERYQSAAGVRADLERCLEELKGIGTIEPFPVAMKDVPGRFMLPSKIYGRDAETRELVSCFNRIAAGAREMVLVSGPPGIGKTALVNELQNYVVERQAYFISSKFDQFARNTPYSAIIGAFRKLVNQLLPEPAEDLALWRHKIQDTVGANGQAIVEFIPELELIIGPQPPVIALKPEESRNRFRVLFYSFAALFCTRQHPLVLFLDDLQWADIHSLDLIEIMMTIEDGALMLVCAYRDNEVDATHPFMGMTRNIPGQFIVNIPVGHLDVNYTAEIISAIVNRGAGDIEPLADLIQKKTGGNPFFVGEFLKALNEDGLLVFDPGGPSWRWDIGKIRARNFTSNVVELVVAKIRKLRGETQAFLRYASMLGNTFDVTRVAMLAGRSAEDISRECDEAVHEGFIFGLGGNIYAFAHDRIQQGAYGMMREDELPAEHLRAGRLLIAGIPEDELDENIFAVLDQYNKGTGLVVSAEEKMHVARLNHRAARRARQITAFDLAYTFLRAGIGLLDEASWENEYDLTLAMYSDAAETAFLSGDHREMQRIGEVILERARTLIDKVPFHIVSIVALSSQAKFKEALDVGLDILDGLGFYIPRPPRKAHIILAFMKARAKMRGKTPEEIAAFPELKDERLLAVLGIVDCLINAAFNSSPEMLALLNFKNVSLLIRHKVSCRYSRMLLCMFGMVFLVSIRGKVELGREVERLYSLPGRRPDAKADEATMQFAMAFFYFHRVANLRATLPICSEAYRIGLEYGNFTYAANAVLVAARNMLLRGEELPRCEKFISDHIQPLKRIRQDRAVSALWLNRQFLAKLRIAAEDPCTFSNDEFQEDQIISAHELRNDF
jgi:predicted ATPase